MFLGVLTVLGIVIALGFALVQNTPGFLTTALAGEAANPFAHNDGNITVLMFDAEW
jgi:tRNA A37 threonylcarbamoyladenosine modification protein TsaB